MNFHPISSKKRAYNPVGSACGNKRAVNIHMDVSELSLRFWQGFFGCTSQSHNLSGSNPLGNFTL
jgi:hypothetical protein